MGEIHYGTRKAFALENEALRVVVTVEGGHIAALEDKASGVNPLWTPPWASMEPSQYDPELHPEYGRNAESKLLAGILGHNLCMDIFGGPSEEEAAAGLPVHGEASVASYAIAEQEESLSQSARFPEAGLAFQRTLRLGAGSRVVVIEETVENLTSTDRPIGWTQHVTLGPPFLERGKTRFECSATRSKVIEHDFTGGKGYMEIGVEFEWPHVPRIGGGTEDMRIFTDRDVSGAFSTHLMDLSTEHAWFVAWHPEMKLACGYVWNRKEFPWLGIWEENRSRTALPWNGETITRGMEFGVSPMPESRRAMVERGSLFGVPGFRWIPAKSRVTAKYCAFVQPLENAPGAVAWDGNSGVRLG